MATVKFNIWRGDPDSGRFESYDAEISEGMVVLDAVHQIQAVYANDLAVRWNCKAGKCGSCSAEINGRPKLMCMTRMSDMPKDKPVKIEPMKAFPVIRDLVTDVSWNYRVKQKVRKFKPRPPDHQDGTWRMSQDDIDRVQEFRKCIECFLCQNVCHVLREHHLHEEFIGPRQMVYNAALEMHPLDVEDRLEDLKEIGGIGFCNITKCCTTVCPEGITITDNAIIPLKERVADRFYDPLKRFFSLFKKRCEMMTTESEKQDEVKNFELKPISKEGLFAALEKAGRYRLLNQPMLAESICLDVLRVDPENEQATIELLLALTDQFSPGSTRTAKRAMELAKSFRNEYFKNYYSGIIHERQGTASLKSNVPGCEFDAYEWYREAMEFYEKSETLAPNGNDDPVLRWNTCARIINDYNLGPRPADDSVQFLE